MEGRKSRGRTSKRWIDQARIFTGMSLQEAMLAAEDTEEWRNIVEDIWKTGHLPSVFERTESKGENELNDTKNSFSDIIDALILNFLWSLVTAKITSEINSASNEFIGSY